MKIWAISDTHGMHEQLKVPEGIDMVIYGGDCSNSFSKAINFNEVAKFLEWWNALDIPHKVLIAGNHDTSMENNMHGFNKLDKSRNFHYLEHQFKEIEGLKIFGSPFTPTFGTWAFMKDRAKMDKLWEHIPDNLDILVVHGPPKGILDLSENRFGEIEQCGDKALLRHVLHRKPKVMIFGHIHNYKEYMNQGIREHGGVKFMNVSCVEDGKFDIGLTSNGITFEL